MDLRDYLRVLRKGWPLILAFVVLGSAAGIGLTVTTSKVYQGTAQVFVSATPNDSVAALAQGNSFTQDRVQSYVDLANSPAVTAAVVKELGLSMSQQTLASKITADAPQNKVLINLHVTDHDPNQAARLTNAVAAQFDTFVENTEQTDATGKPVIKLTLVHPATVPSSPIKPSKIINIGLGFVLGLLLGIGFVFLRDVLDNTVKGPQDFDELGIPVLGLVPFDKRTPKIPIAFRGDPHSARSEAYRQMRTNMQFINVDHAPRVIAVTSAVPGEGKTTTALNLAAALAEGGFRVCLVEADLRRPTLAKTLGLVGDVGFTTVLIGKARVEDVLQNAGRNLAVLTCGPVPPNPSELLITEQASTIIRRIAEKVDFTIIDTAPLLPVADGAEVAAMADATLVVHHAGKSTKDQAARSIERLAQVGERPVGVILNMITRARGNYDYSYGYYYAYRPDRSGAKRRKDAGEAQQLPSYDNDLPATEPGAPEPGAPETVPAVVAAAALPAGQPDALPPTASSSTDSLSGDSLSTGRIDSRSDDAVSHSGRSRRRHLRKSDSERGAPKQRRGARAAAPNEGPVAEPAGAEPAVLDAAIAEPPVAEPPVAEPAVAEAGIAEPPVAEPAAAEPPVAEPAVAEPAGAEPAGAEPAGAEPAGAEPAVADSLASEPAAETRAPEAQPQDAQIPLAPYQPAHPEHSGLSNGQLAHAPVDRHSASASTRAIWLDVPDAEPPEHVSPEAQTLEVPAVGTGSPETTAQPSQEDAVTEPAPAESAVPEPTSAEQADELAPHGLDALWTTSSTLPAVDSASAHSARSHRRRGLFAAKRKEQSRGEQAPALPDLRTEEFLRGTAGPHHGLPSTASDTTDANAGEPDAAHAAVEPVEAEPVAQPTYAPAHFVPPGAALSAERPSEDDEHPEFGTPVPEQRLPIWTGEPQG